MFLSIIVPVYNSEEYLPFCIDSVKRQSFTDFEVLLVDDGSTDSSKEICCSIQEQDHRFIYILREKNGGTAAARNTGLRMARGEYVTFLDNDDYWNSDSALQNLFNFSKANNSPDVILYPTLNLWSSSGELTRSSKGTGLPTVSSHTNRYIEHLLKRGQYAAAVWAKTVKRKLILENDLFFTEGIRNEDSDWSLRLLYCLSTISWMDSPFYVWRRNSSVSQSVGSISLPIVQDLAFIINKHVDYLKFHSSIKDKERLDLSTAYVAYLFVVLLSYLYMKDEDGFLVLRKEQKKNCWLLNYNLNPRVRMVSLAVKIFGIDKVGKILAFLMIRERKSVSNR